MFTTDIKKTESVSNFEVKFTNLLFELHESGLMFMVRRPRYQLGRPVTAADATNVPVSIRRYMVVKNQGFRFHGRNDAGPATANVTNATPRIRPATFTVTTVDHSLIDHAPMVFEVTFVGLSVARVLRVLPDGLDQVKLEYCVKQLLKSFSFKNVSDVELSKLKTMTALRYDREAEEALKVGIFMLVLGGIGHSKLRSMEGSDRFVEGDLIEMTGDREEFDTADTPREAAGDTDEGSLVDRTRLGFDEGQD